MSRADVEGMLANLCDSDPRTAAEVAYVLAVDDLRCGNRAGAAEYGGQCIRLLDKCRMDTLEDCAARLVTLLDIALPSIFHQDVVRERLRTAFTETGAAQR